MRRMIFIEPGMLDWENAPPPVIGGAGEAIVRPLVMGRCAELPLQQIYYKGLTYRIGRPNCRHGHAPALDAWASKGFRPEKLGPKLYPFEKAVEAWLDPALYVAVTSV